MRSENMNNTIKFYVLLFFFVAALQVVLGVKAITCVTSDNQETCSERGLFYREGVLFGGLCPGCVSLPGEGEACEGLAGCQPGFACNATYICVKDPLQVCFWEKDSAEKVPGTWIPECTPDGRYAPKQCKGEPLLGKCFCSDPSGQRIFGEAEWKYADDMTCECNRLVWELQQTRPDVTIHCTEQGLFEEMQCDDGVCWCARQKNGEPYTAVLPEQAWMALPCYNTTLHGNNYLKRCDSIRKAQERTKKILAVHGTINIAFDDVFCNYDGSYSRIQNNPTGIGRVCVSKDRTQINEFTIDSEAKGVTCNCAYDKYVAEGPFNKKCDSNGDYQTIQQSGGQTFCVDEDGFPTPCPKP